MNINELLAMRYLLVFVKEGVFGFTKLFFKDEFASHKYLTSDDYVQEIILAMKNLRMLVDC